MRDRQGASGQVSAEMRQDAVMDEYSILAAFRQTASFALQCALRQPTVSGLHFIGLFEGFLTLLPEHPKQTPLFILSARQLARESGLPNWSRA